MLTIRRSCRRLVDHATVTVASLLVVAVAMASLTALGDDVPIKQPAELLRKNGTVLPVPLLLKVRGGNVSAHSDTSLAPLTFRPGEIQAIRFQQREPEPEINGTCRLKYFYDAASKSFEKHKIMATISPWRVSQASTVEEVLETVISRNGDGEAVLQTTKKNKIVYAPTATLAATFVNKEPEALIVGYELLLVTTAGQFIHNEEITLGSEESKDVEIDVPTGGRGIQQAIISDVYNRVAAK